MTDAPPPMSNEMDPISREELHAARLRFRRGVMTALAEAYAYALRNGWSPEELAAKADRSVTWIIQCITDPMSLTIEDMARFGLVCGVEITFSIRPAPPPKEGGQ